MKDFGDVSDTLLARRDSRRGLLGKAAIGSIAFSAAGLLAGCGGDSGGGSSSSGSTATDLSILNFALNLEYLEGEYYTRALGQDLPAGDVGANPGTVTGGTAVPFQTPLYQAICEELASDEQHHVEDLRSAIRAQGGTPVDRPAINFTAGFSALATAAGLSGGFNPFTDEEGFMLGAFIFEDVGVTAYTGATALLSANNVLTAAEILGVEAYHAGSIRTIIAQIGGGVVSIANSIAAARATVDGSGNDDTGVTGPANTYNGTTYIADTNPTTGLTYPRTTTQVLKIVYAGGNPGVGGGFFPNGLNGTIR